MRGELIELDSDLGIRLGFTSNKFDGYLGKLDDAIYISYRVKKIYERD